MFSLKLCSSFSFWIGLYRIHPWLERAALFSELMNPILGIKKSLTVLYRTRAECSPGGVGGL